MAVAKFDTYGTESFVAGDVLVDNSNYPNYAMKVLKRVYVDDVAEYRLIMHYGKVSSGKFVGDMTGSSSSRRADLALYTEKSARNNFVGKWTEDKDTTEPGDVLKNQHGKVFIVDGTKSVWQVDSGTHASRSYWEAEGHIFTQLKTASNQKFSAHLKMGLR